MKYTVHNWDCTGQFYVKWVSIISNLPLKTNYIYIYIYIYIHNTTLFTSEPKIVNKTTRVQRSSIHWFIHSTVLEFVWNQTETTSSAGHQYGWHIFPKDPQKGGNKVEFDSMETKYDMREYTWHTFLWWKLDGTFWIKHATKWGHNRILPSSLHFILCSMRYSTIPFPQKPLFCGGMNLKMLGLLHLVIRLID